MCCPPSHCIELKDFLLLILGFLLSIVWTFILYKLKPNLEIESIDKNDHGDFWIKIQNNMFYPPYLSSKRHHSLLKDSQAI